MYVRIVYAEQGPGSWQRALAEVSDEQLADELRQGLIAAGLLHDAWWPDARSTAGDYAQRRATKLDQTRIEVAALGRAATLDQLCKAIRPLLGDYWRPDELHEAIRALAATAINKVTMVRDAREGVSRWDAENRAPSQAGLDGYGPPAGTTFG